MNHTTAKRRGGASFFPKKLSPDNRVIKDRANPERKPNIQVRIVGAHASNNVQVQPQQAVSPDSLMLKNIPFDSTTISQDRLNIESKVRSNLFPWNGQFSPQLVHTLLETYAKSGDQILDPFLGSGTVLAEAGRLGLWAFGSEINPAAFQMAQTYKLMNMKAREKRNILSRIDHVLYASFGGRSLFSVNGDSPNEEDTKEKIIEIWTAEKCQDCRLLLGALIVLLDFFKQGISPNAILSKWEKLKARLLSLPYSQGAIDVVNADARRLPLRTGTVDIVLTSPPYINVFNYHQQYRASAEALGWDLLHVARSEMGSNRKNRGNRFLTVIQYCLDIAQALAELRRVCKPSARIILVVGRESNVMGTRFFNGDIVAALGVRCVGLKAERRQERVFKNKFGSLIYEDIIHFRQSREEEFDRVAPSTIARECLTAALEYAPKESYVDLEDALTKLRDIKPSVFFDARKAPEKETA